MPDKEFRIIILVVLLLNFSCQVLPSKRVNFEPCNVNKAVICHELLIKIKKMKVPTPFLQQTHLLFHFSKITRTTKGTEQNCWNGNRSQLQPQQIFNRRCSSSSCNKALWTPEWHWRLDLPTEVNLDSGHFFSSVNMSKKQEQKKEVYF